MKCHLLPYLDATREDNSDIGEALSVEALSERELAFEERIDGKIAKDLKELSQMKTMKIIGLGKSCPTVASESLKLTDSPPIHVAENE
jgi:hypothetical protein